MLKRLYVNYLLIGVGSNPRDWSLHHFECVEHGPISAARNHSLLTGLISRKSRNYMSVVVRALSKFIAIKWFSYDFRISTGC
jgi:hypothetical protein